MKETAIIPPQMILEVINSFDASSEEVRTQEWPTCTGIDKETYQLEHYNQKWHNNIR